MSIARLLLPCHGGGLISNYNDMRCEILKEFPIECQLHNYCWKEAAIVHCRVGNYPVTGAVAYQELIVLPNYISAPSAVQYFIRYFYLYFSGVEKIVRLSSLIIVR